MDSEKEKNRLSDIVLERVGLTGNLLSAPVSPSLEPVVEIPSHGSQVRAGKVTGPEEYKRRFLVPAPRAAEWKTAYIDGRLHRRIAMLVRAAGCGSCRTATPACRARRSGGSPTSPRWKCWPPDAGFRSQGWPTHDTGVAGARARRQRHGRAGHGPWQAARRPLRLIRYG